MKGRDEVALYFSLDACITYEFALYSEHAYVFDHFIWQFILAHSHIFQLVYVASDQDFVIQVTLNVVKELCKTLFVIKIHWFPSFTFLKSFPTNSIQDTVR